MKPLAITEADKDIIAGWFARQEIESIDAFIKKLDTEYEHDYGTICKAMAAVALQAARKMDQQSQGGITGFQAGAVMWDFVQAWMSLEGPLRLVQYNDMLYPQSAYKFEKTISADCWADLQAEAKKRVAEYHQQGTDAHCHPNVLVHWYSIINGVVPFGYTVKEDE